MRIIDILQAEWKPALGCTEPAAVAWAAALAAGQAGGTPQRVHLRCDPRTYKNCYAVGLPFPGRRTGILWALATGACLPSPDRGLRSFELASEDIVELASHLLAAAQVTVDVDAALTELCVDVTVQGAHGIGRALIQQSHTNLVRLEQNGVPQPVSASGGCAPGASPRPLLGTLSIRQLWDLVQDLDPASRTRIQEGIALNLAIAEHGLSLLPEAMRPAPGQDLQGRVAAMVASGVHARMSGETLPVMSLAGSGNKGITVTVPVVLWAREKGHAEAEIERALAFAIVMTAAVTHHLGTLSAICGAANAGGIGIASALILLQGGGPEAVSLMVNNMVGNVAGMICDGAKIGCAMKTTTGVDAAFRAAHMALTGIGIPGTDGIVGTDGEASLANLGRLAQIGMAGVDAEILAIMQAKLRQA